MQFGNRLRKLREDAGLCQAELARILDVERTRYNKWEQGINQPKYDTLCKIADYFHVSVDYLIGHEINSKTKKCLTVSVSMKDTDLFKRMTKVISALIDDRCTPEWVKEKIKKLVFDEFGN